MLAQVLRLFREVFLGLPVSGDLSEFRAVRGNDGCALVAVVIRSFRINKNGFSGVPCDLNHLFDMREPAFAVIGKNHSVMRRDFPPEGIQVREQNFLLRHAFEVSPQHLLLPGDDPQLHGGFQLRVEVEEWPDRGVMQECLEVLSGFIVSKNREKRNTGSHGGDIPGNVRGAAEALL